MRTQDTGPDPAPHDLRRLARLYGLECGYRDVSGAVRQAGATALLQVLRALGAPVESSADVRGACRARHEALWARMCEPVTVLWRDEPEGPPAGSGAVGTLRLRLNGSRPAARAGYHLILESREELSGVIDVGESRVKGAVRDGARHFVEIPLPEEPFRRIPHGYHRLALEVGDETCETLVIVAPVRVASLAAERARAWGVFLPLFALHSSRSTGIGDFSDLADLAAWAASRGASFTGTLPLLATHVDPSVSFSPYSPASRIFWNEMHLDLRSIPDLTECGPARDALEAAQAALGSGSRQIDYNELSRHRRSVLEALAEGFFEHGAPERQTAFDRFLAARPEARAYAGFRAAGEAYGRDWRDWPGAEPDVASDAHSLPGALQTDPLGANEAARYHLYSQWQCDEQMRSLTDRCREAGTSLYLDLPVGAPPDSFDAWMHRGHFVDGCIAGAPPDGFFEQGQTWGFAPLRPEALRESGYRYWIDCLRHHMAVSGILRIDHVMGLRRMYCVPDGFAADQGIYLRYAVQELFAVLAVESARSGCAVVGEDLGTVPWAVREQMHRHGVLRTHVLQGDMSPPDGARDVEPPAASMACLGTHDMPPFAAYWMRAREVDDADDPRVRESAMAAMREALCALAEGPARLVQVNLDDLWGETEPHNVPGTHGLRANWSRRSLHSLESIREMEDVVTTLDEVERLRRDSEENDA